MGLRVAEGLMVKIAYRMTDIDGRVLEERTPETPYEYKQGGGQIVAPIERVLEGKTPGFQTELSISPREGYGDYDSGLVTEVSRAHLPPNVELVVGMKFNTVSPTGDPMIVRIIAVEEGVVTLDGNHPLAGLILNFEIRLLDVHDPEHEAKVEMNVKLRRRTSEQH